MAKKAKKAAKAKPSKKPATKKMRSKHEQIGEQDFRNLVSRCANRGKQAKEITGEIGKLIANAVENKNLDRVAFSMFRKLDAMSPEKLATTLSCLDYYIEVGKLEDKIESAPALPIARQEAGEKEDGEPSQKKKKNDKGDNVIDMPVVQAAE